MNFSFCSSRCQIRLLRFNDFVIIIIVHRLVNTCFVHTQHVAVPQQVVHIKPTSFSQAGHVVGTPRDTWAGLIKDCHFIRIFFLLILNTPVSHLYLFYCLCIECRIKVVPNPQSHLIVDLYVKKKWKKGRNHFPLWSLRDCEGVRFHPTQWQNHMHTHTHTHTHTVLAPSHAHS